MAGALVANVDLPVEAPRSAEGSSNAKRGGLADALATGAPQVAAPGDGAPRLEALDAQRWLASVQVIAFHFYNYTWGSIWTQFFFVLSGFVLAYVEMARPSSKVNKVTQMGYVRNRLITIYPTYCLVMLLSELQWQHSAMDWITLPLHLLLMQAWFPITYRMEGALIWSWTGMQWVQVAWFVSVLVLYWLILRPVTRLVRQLTLRVCYVVLFVLWSWSAVIWALGDILLTRELGCLPTQMNRCYSAAGMGMLYQGPCGFLHVFLAGVVMARVFVLTCMCDSATGLCPGPETVRLALDKQRAPCFLRYGVCIGYASFGLLITFGTDELFMNYRFLFHNGGVLPLMLLLLAGGSIGCDPIAKYVCQNRLFAVLGRMSYAQYLLQYNVWYLMAAYFPNKADLQLVFPFALLLLAFLVERCVTRIVTEWQRWRAEKGIQSSVVRAWAVLSANVQALRSIRCKRGSKRPAAEEELDESEDSMSQGEDSRP